MDERKHSPSISNKAAKIFSHHKARLGKKIGTLNETVDDHFEVTRGKLTQKINDLEDILFFLGKISKEQHTLVFMQPLRELAQFYQYDTLLHSFCIEAIEKVNRQVCKYAKSSLRSNNLITDYLNRFQDIKQQMEYRDDRLIDYDKWRARFKSNPNNERTQKKLEFHEQRYKAITTQIYDEWNSILALRNESFDPIVTKVLQDYSAFHDSLHQIYANFSKEMNNSMSAEKKKLMEERMKLVEFQKAHQKVDTESCEDEPSVPNANEDTLAFEKKQVQTEEALQKKQMDEALLKKKQMDEALLKKKQMEEEALKKKNLEEETLKKQPPGPPKKVPPKIIPKEKSAEKPTPVARMPPPPPKKDAPTPSPSSTTFSLSEISPQDIEKYRILFVKTDLNKDGFVDGQEALAFFMKSDLPRPLLSTIWRLSDFDQDNKLDQDEFIVAMHLVYSCLRNIPLPDTVPASIVPKSKLKFIQ